MTIEQDTVSELFPVEGKVLPGRRPKRHHWPLAQSRGSSGARGFHNIGVGLNLTPDVDSDGVDAKLTFGTPDWNRAQVGVVMQFRQVSTGRWVESHGGRVLTVREPTGRAGLWVIAQEGGTTSIRHLETAAFLNVGPAPEAHAFTEAADATLAQTWALHRQGARTFSIQQSSTGRFLDAHVVASHRVVTRPAQGNDTQLFEVIVVGSVNSLEPSFDEGRFLDAHVVGDRNAVMRAAQHNDTQEWAIVELEADEFWPLVTVQQVATGRYLTALATPGSQFETKPVKLRPGAEDNNQVWSMTGP